jgi:hypothetical protein
MIEVSMSIVLQLAKTFQECNSALTKAHLKFHNSSTWLKKNTQARGTAMSGEQAILQEIAHS